MNMDEEDAVKKPYKYRKVEPEGPSRRCMYIVLTGAFLCIVLSILLAIFLTKKPKNYCPEGLHCSWHSVPSSEYLKDRRCDRLCTSVPCLRTAQFILSRIDSIKDPCKDFYEFTCGRFENEYSLFPEDTKGIHIYEEMETQMLLTLKGIIDSIAERPGKKGFSLLLTKALYDDCMKADDSRVVLSKNIWRKMFSGNDILPPWPLIIKNTRYDLRHLMKMMSSSLFFKENPFFTVLVPQEETLNNASKWKFHVTEPNLEHLKSIYKDIHTHNESNIYVRYQLLIRKILTEVGRNVTDIENITNETMEFEKAFLKAATRAKKSSELLYRKKQDLRYKKHTHSCQELEHRLKHVKWCRMFRQLLADYGIADKPNMAITLPAVMDYFEEMDKIFSRFSYREIINYIALKFIVSHLKYMSSPLRDTYYRDQGLFPQKNYFRKLLTRWQQCVDIVSEFVWLPLEREYLKQVFNGEKDARVHYVVRKMKETYLSSIEKLSWLKDAFPGKNLKEMIQEIDVKIGISDQLTYTDSRALDRYLKKIKMDTSHTGKRKNLLIVDILRLKALLIKAPLSNVKEIQILDSFESFSVSNGNFVKNQIDIPYGVLDFPMFLPGRPMYMEYATFGSYIFNSMTVNLLSDMAEQNSSLLSLSNPAKCVKEKFDASKTRKTELKVNLPEDAELLFHFSHVLATLGSFQAYKTYLKENGEEKGLPGLPLTNEQLFFIANAQVNCEKFTEKGYADYPSELVIPARDRVNLPLANSKEFARAFRCPCNSRMNPRQKCCILGDGNLSPDCG